MLPSPPEGLRHWRPADAPALEAAWRDPEVARWNPPPTGLSAEDWIAGVAERWERRLALDLVVIPPAGDRADRRAGGAVRAERADPGVAGEVGLSSFTGLDEAGPARAELGVWIAAPQRGRGVATRAVRSVTTWALDPAGLGLEQLWARCDPANATSEALFARAGWDRLGLTGGKAIWSATRVLLR